jgi:hypothetical protein
MIIARFLQRAVIAGVILQLALAVLGHFVPWIVDHFFMFGRMMLSATAGYIYGMQYGRTYVLSALGGAVAGGLCVVPALAVSILLGDTPASFLAIGTGISILTGGVGGAFGQMAAIMRKLGF